MNVSFKEVSRAQFNDIADRISTIKGNGSVVTVHYNGTNLYGGLIIDCVGDHKSFNAALQIATEVITGNKEG